MKVISTTNAPGAIGPYSQGYAANGMIFTSGQIPIDPATGEMPEGIKEQTEQSCKNVIAILEAAGSGAEKVVKTTCFQVLHFQARKKLRGSEADPQGSALRDRVHCIGLRPAEAK